MIYIYVPLCANHINTFFRNNCKSVGNTWAAFGPACTARAQRSPVRFKHNNNIIVRMRAALAPEAFV